jgi:hypothetical protein
MDTELELSNQQWKFKKWDVRADGKVFWRYQKTSYNNQHWVTWEQALKYQESMCNSTRKYRSTTNGKNKQKEWRKSTSCKTSQNKWKQSPKGIIYRKNYYKSEKHLNYIRNRQESNAIVAMARRLRTRINNVFRRKGYNKQSTTKQILGCSWEHLVMHIESNFNDNMNWGNRHLWHIDHIIPLASAQSLDDLIRLNHYTNLQPLWAKDNLKKGAKIQNLSDAL